MKAVKKINRLNILKDFEIIIDNTVIDRRISQADEIMSEDSESELTQSTNTSDSTQSSEISV